MDKLFDSVWVLRITALILAVSLFFHVNGNSDAKKNTVSNTQVETIKDVPLEAYYDEENLSVKGLPKTVDVTIEGPMAIVLETKITKDFKVFVDLSKLLIGEHRVAVQAEGLSDKLDVSLDPKYINIKIEEKVTKEFTVEPEINKQLIASDYVLQSITAEPTTVKITGAKSVIDNISYVKANVTGQKGIKDTFQQKVNVKVLDGNLNSLDVSVNPETVNVKVVVVPYKKSVPIKIKRTGKPKEGITINSIKANLQAVDVYGPKSIVDSLEELVVEFDVSKVDKSGEYKLKLVLPEGATRISAETITLVVDITDANEEKSSEDENNENEKRKE